MKCTRLKELLLLLAIAITGIALATWEIHVLETPASPAAGDSTVVAQPGHPQW